jgi:hypothetical protein
MYSINKASLMEAIEKIRLQYEKSLALQVLFIKEFIENRNVKEKQFLVKFFQKTSKQTNLSLEEFILASLSEDNISPVTLLQTPLKIYCEAESGNGFEKKFNNWIHENSESILLVRENHFYSDTYEIDILPIPFLELYDATHHLMKFEIL